MKLYVLMVNNGLSFDLESLHRLIFLLEMFIFVFVSLGLTITEIKYNKPFSKLNLSINNRTSALDCNHNGISLSKEFNYSLRCFLQILNSL